VKRIRPGLTVVLRRVSLLRNARHILRLIDWEIAAGQRWVLLGENGAGKTQLLKLLAGDVWPTPDNRAERHYQWRGETLLEPYDVRQEIAYLGSERQDRHEHYEWNYRASTVVGTGLQRADIPQGTFSAADQRQIAGALRACGVAALAAKRFLTLSYGQRRLVLLARALAWRSPLLLLDELFAGLDENYRQQVQAVIARLARSAASWVISTHRPEDIPPSATHLLCLRRGRVAWQGTLRAARAANIIARYGLAPMTSRVAAARRPPQPAAEVARHRKQSRVPAPLIQLRNAWVWLDGHPVLKRLSFNINDGDCWVIHGPNGSGKSTLIRALYGDIGVASQGAVRRRGIELGVPISAFKQRVGIVAPELQSIHPLYLTALEVVVSGLHSSVGLDAAPTMSERRRAVATLRELQAQSLAARELRSLSYGQVRRVLFARALVHRPAILLLDEPYTGLDARTRNVLQARIERAVAQGITLIMTTHHRDEWPQLATQELHLRSGAAAYCGTVRSV
jgi:molybdate transport system ATP-binding protein